MAGSFVDLPVHSFYSDGSMSPDEIVEAALANNVGLLAIADHDLIEGSLSVRELCKACGIKYIPAVEIDSFENGKNFHILAYGFDIHDKEFCDFLSHTRFLLDELGVKLIEVMHSDYDSVSLADYMDFSSVFLVQSSISLFRISSDIMPFGSHHVNTLKWYTPFDAPRVIFSIKFCEGAVVEGGYSKKHLTDHSKENPERFLTETCRAELTHFPAILPFWIFGLFTPTIVIVFMLIYAVAVNMPCIITQRYNRIRLARVLKKHYT